MQKKVKNYVRFFKFFKKANYKLSNVLTYTSVYLKIKTNDVIVGKGFKCNGVPVIDVYEQGQFCIGDNFTMNNGSKFNRIGRQQPCYFIVLDYACLTIGNNVGMSSTAIVCHQEISIGNNVKIGGNVTIYDTDFHSLDKENRKVYAEDVKFMKTKPVRIDDDVFIGAHSIILKGVTIGEGAIIGAGSVVSKSVPANEIWAGNPARFIRANMAAQLSY
jgi:acetyltransferase-like isoleucine patch superfamily enzyme